MDRVLTLLGRADQLRTLTAVSGARLRRGHPLDDPSHIVLREVARTEGLAAVHAYLDRPALRPELLARVVRGLREIDYGPLREHGIDPQAVCTVSGAALAAARALLPGCATGRVDGDTLHWANQRSFAVLRLGAGEVRAGHPFTAVTERAASVYARRFYGLSVAGHDGFFLWPASIRVVATGYERLAARAAPVPGLTAWQRHGIALLREIPGRLERQVPEMFGTHEVAHTYHLGRGSPVLDALTRTGHDPADAFRHGIPGPHQLGAWHRLAGGGGTPVQNTFDVTFLLSDVLATLTQALGRPADVINRLQVAYLWQVAGPPTPRSPRRGVITSLRAAELLDTPALLGDIEEVFTAARVAPGGVPGLLARLEHRSLRLLREHFPDAAP